MNKTDTPNETLLNACKMAYRKHHLDDPNIGWGELGIVLLDAICEAIGDDGYSEWLQSLRGPAGTFFSGEPAPGPSRFLVYGPGLSMGYEAMEEARQAIKNHPTCEIYVRLNTPDTPPALDDQLRWILGRPSFMLAALAEKLRRMGWDIAHKAEDEQASVIYWMLCLYRDHGKHWRNAGEAMLKQITLPPTEGNHP